MERPLPGSQIPDAIRTLLGELGEDPAREGLVDTAVRTSRSGYMQRRLINALEDQSTTAETLPSFL